MKNTAISKKSNKRKTTGIEKQARLRFHEGKALETIANTYPDLLKVCLEIIQNAIDSNAQRIEVYVNLKESWVRVRDNGDGVSRTKFEQALSEVGLSQKTKGKLGKFGIGLISPFGKCEQFEFTSKNGKSSKAIKWTFTNDILQQSSNLTVPFAEVKHDPNEWWHSEMRLFGITNDSSIRKISVASLVAETLNNFGLAMKKSGVTVYVNLAKDDGTVENKKFTADEFRGTSLGEFRYESAGCVTVLKIFKANRTGGKYKGTLLVSAKDDNFTIPLSRVLNYFSNQSLLDSAIVKALNSGIFEGTIESDIDLHPNRRSFISNDRFVEFLSHLESWYNEHGKEVFEEVMNDTRLERYQDVGNQSMKVIDNMLNNERFKELKKLFEGFKTKSTGGLEAYTKPIKEGGDTPEDKDKVGTGKPKKNRDSEKDAESGSGEGLGFRHTRKTIKSNSTGLKFSYDEMPGSPDLYGFDEQYGVVKFNIRHPLWETCENRNSALMRLQERVAIHILSSLQFPVEQRAILEEAFYKTIGAEVHLMLNAVNVVRGKISTKLPEPV